MDDTHPSRSATVARRTAETDITVTLSLDGVGAADVDTGIGFLDHMLTALARAVGDKRGIRRYGQSLLPMDEALVEAALDLSGRPFLAWDVAFGRDKIGAMDTELFEEFFRALAMNGLLTLHVTRRAGRNAHHVAEATFKAVARALRMAVEPDPRASDVIPSTKGSL